MRDPFEKYARIANWQKANGLWLPGVMPFRFSPGGCGCKLTCEACHDYEYEVTFTGVTAGGCGDTFCSSMNTTFALTFYVHQPNYKTCLYRYYFDPQTCFSWIQLAIDYSNATSWNWRLYLYIDEIMYYWSYYAEPSCEIDTSDFGLVIYNTATCSIFTPPHLVSVAP